jgi:hypothetical protein
MKEEPSVILRFDCLDRVYRPGEALSGEFTFVDLPENPAKTLEVSVVWFTEGKGDEDMAVHEFWRTNLEENAVDLSGPQRFSTILPGSPLTYDGRIVKVRWCVRVRIFFQGGKEVFGQKLFRLGEVRALHPPPKSTAAEPME